MSNRLQLGALKHRFERPLPSGGTNLVVMYGEKEGSDYPLLKKRSEETANLATSSKLIIVENAPHDISFPEYQTAIKQVV